MHVKKHNIELSGAGVRSKAAPPTQGRALYDCQHSGEQGWKPTGPTHPEHRGWKEETKASKGRGGGNRSLGMLQESSLSHNSRGNLVGLSVVKGT